MKRPWYALRFPAEVNPEAVIAFTRALSVRARHGTFGSADLVVCEVQGSGGRLTWSLSASAREERQLLQSLRLALPGVSVEPHGSARLTPDAAWELRLSSQRRPLRTAIPEQVAAGLLAALQRTGPNETVLLQWCIGPWLPRRVVPAAVSPRQRRDPSLFKLNQLLMDSEQAKALRDKQAEPFFGVVGRIAVQASSTARQRALRQQLLGALQLMRSPGVGFERRLLPSFIVTSRFTRLAQPLVEWPCVLSASELASALGWPIGAPALPGLSYRSARQLPPTASTLVGARTAHRNVRTTGEATYPGQTGRLQLPAPAGLHHLHVLGPTGTGKSTLIAGLALQDIVAGRSVVVVDPSPKGDLVLDIAERIPPERLSDTVLLDPSDKAPVGLNVLSGTSPDVAADGVVHVVHDLYAAHWGPRTADVLSNALITLARTPGMTLCELPPLLLNPTFRRRLTGPLRSDALGVGPFWAWFEALSEPERATVCGPVLNKLRAFTQRPAIRAVIGQENGFNLRSVFTKCKVLLVRLPAGEVGSEAAQLLGALLLGQLWTAVQGRSAVAPQRRHPAFVYLDEFQQVMRLPLDLGDALAQARGFGVGLVMAHQHLAQLRPDVRAAVLANARSTIAFGLGRDDALAMSKLLGSGLTPEDLQGLPAFETYQALFADGRTAPPASARTLPLGPSLGSLEAVREHSRRAFGRPRADVDADMLARRQVAAKDSAVGVRKRGGQA